MKSFSFHFQVENAEELLQQLEALTEAVSSPTQQRFIDNMQVDDDATFIEEFDWQPVTLTRPE